MAPETKIADGVREVLQRRGPPASERPFTEAEWAVIAQHGRPAVDVELRRLEEKLNDGGFYRSGFTLGSTPQVDTFEGFDREAATP